MSSNHTLPPIRFCAYLPCFAAFTPRRPNQHYCCWQHQRQANHSTYYHRRKRKIQRLLQLESQLERKNQCCPTSPNSES